MYFRQKKKGNTKRCERSFLKAIKINKNRQNQVYFKTVKMQNKNNT